MGLDDILGKAGDALGSDGVQNALHSEQAEQISDNILDKVGDAAEGLTGHKFDEQIEQGKGFLDGKIGTE